jgi:hypothetical protein
VSNSPIKCLNSNNQYFQYLITKISKLQDHLDYELCWQGRKEESESESPNLSGLVIWIFWLLNIENFSC